jgi:hypothetical protein
MTEYDNIVVAAQEHAAKHAGAFVYSPAYRKMADALSAERLAFMPSINHISRLRYRYSWVRKVFFSYTDGVKACCRNIRRQWVYEYCSSSCRYFESQIEIVSKSVGKLSKGMEGMSVDNLHKMLKLAVIEQDEDAIATLSAIGIIAIDEATYVQAVTVVNDDMVELRVLMIL